MEYEVKLADKINGPSVIKIQSGDIVQILRDIIISHWNPTNDNVDFFPAPQPVSLERRDIKKIIEYDYTVCVKSDGMRFVMIFYNGECYMVDRAFSIYKTEIKITNKLLAVFDGELILNKKTIWTYIIHDCINIYENNITQSTFTERYKEINIFLIANIDKINNIEITTKKFYDFKNLTELNDEIKNNKIDHEIDGLIFIPTNKRVGKFTQYDLFKWKPRHSHTFDFKIEVGNSGIVAYVSKNKIHIPYANAERGSKEEIYFLKHLNLNCKDFHNNCIVECDYDEKNDIYKPLLVRNDKIHPNSLYTVKKTLENIKENITLDELIELSKSA